MAREEFVYFETVALPELVKYFKTLRAPIRPEDAVLIYVTDPTPKGVGLGLAGLRATP